VEHLSDWTEEGNEPGVGASRLTDLQPKGGDLESGDLFVQSRILPTDGWSVRDVGPAELIRLKLSDYGTMLQIELPHAPDLRAFY
jgi:hypothetical protein